MKVLPLIAVALLAACGGSTDTAATRYNFAVVAGRNQSSVAGTAVLANRITSQLTRDPQGKFATRVFDFLAPKMAYAQDGLPLPGDPIEGAIVCGRVAPIGEPQVVPLCAFTLADGKAANVVQPGTKAGTYDVLFSAQVPSEAPVVDSTKVTVEAGPASSNFHVAGPLNPSPYLLPANAVQDQYGNSTTYKIIGDANITVAGDGRTLSWSTRVPNYQFLEIQDGAGTRIGTLRYRTGSGSDLLEWVTYGLNSAP